MNLSEEIKKIVSNSRKLKLKVLYENTDITKYIDQDLISFSYSDSLNEFDTLDLTIHNRELLWMNDWNPLKGDLGLDEYATSTYIKKDIDENYEKLKVTLSELDADYRVAVENTEHKTIVVASSTLKYLEKFGLNVICIDEEATDKTISDAEALINDGEISYLYMFDGDSVNSVAKQLLKTYPNLKEQKLHKLINLTDSDRSNNKDYINIMNNNLDLIKQELYQ